MAHEQVEFRNGGYYVGGTRISLDSIVYLYRDGASPEAIQDDFPSLNLEQIHGAIAFYLANLKIVDGGHSQRGAGFQPACLRIAAGHVGSTADVAAWKAAPPSL
jgi:uncharacterized protein (DUF433 family)